MRSENKWVDMLQLLRYMCECECFITVVGGHQPTFTIDAFDYRRLKSNKLNISSREMFYFRTEQTATPLYASSKAQSLRGIRPENGTGT